MARILDQGSRLSAVRLAGSHGICDSVGLDSFNEDDLYANLDSIIRGKLRINFSEPGVRQREFPLFTCMMLPAVIFQGTDNELGAFGYNRDGKRGKKQIVMGLLTDEDGAPISVEVFQGNTVDSKTSVLRLRS